MEKINISELLKDCPTGYPLDCTMYEDVYFDFVDELNIIHCYIQYETHKTSITFNQYGTPHNDIKSKCVIFPKGKTTWERFHRPFEPGDIVITDNDEHAFIYSGENDRFCECYCGVYCGSRNICINSKQWSDKKHKLRLATEEEKEKLFQVIKDNGYKWNPYTKTLEKLIEPKFKVGDWVTNGICKVQIHFITDTHYWYSANCILGSLESVDKQYHLWTINDAKDGDVLFHSDSASNGIFIFKEILQLGTLQKVICYCDYDSEDGFCLGENHTCCWADSKILRPATEERRNRLFQKMREAGYKWNAETKILEKLVEPKFKVGDKVRHKNNHGVVFTITSIEEDYYVTGAARAFWFDDQDDYELVPNKFDISTLIPFESRVLARYCKDSKWIPTFWGSYDKEDPENPYNCCGMLFAQCIPYEGNEHLLGKTDDCDEFYKTWE